MYHTFYKEFKKMRALFKMAAEIIDKVYIYFNKNLRGRKLGVFCINCDESYSQSIYMCARHYIKS